MLVIEADIHEYVGMSYVDKNILGPLVHMSIRIAFIVFELNFINVCLAISHTSIAPSAVRNLTADFNIGVPSSYNSTSGFYEGTLEISWVEPEFLNGVISSYTYIVVGPSPSSDTVYTGSSTSTSVQIDAQLLPVSMYVVTVTATTMGEAGPSSEDFVINTPEASML